MKSINTIIFLLCVISCQSYAQIGINTDTPISSSTLHIDPLGNNTSSTPTISQTTDDVIIDKDGRIGLGTTIPSKLLEIKDKIQIQDGNEANLKVLASDADGNATWKYIGALEYQGGILGTGLTIQSNQTVGKYVDTGASITLPPGGWMVLVSIKLQLTDVPQTAGLASSVWIRSTFSDTTAINSGISSDIKGTTWISANAYPYTPSTLSGFLYIINKGTTAKTYYYKLFQSDATGSMSNSLVKISNFAANMPENYIIAVKVINNQ